jgi:outer membrane protein TolC
MKNSLCLISFLLLFIPFKFYASETLKFSKAYELSLQNSKRIQSLEHKLKANHENLNQVKSLMLPEVNFYGSYTQNNYKDIPVSNLFKVDIKQKVKNYNVILKQPLFDRNLASKMDIEESKYESYKNDLDIEKQKLAKELLDIYLALIKSKNKITMLSKFKEYLDSKKELLKTKYEMDLSTITELLTVESDFNQTNIDLEKEKVLFKVNKEKLISYMGDGLNFKIPGLDDIVFTSDNLKKIKINLVKIDEIYSNLQVDKLKNIMQMHKHELEDAQNNHLPKLSLNLKYTKNVSVENSYTSDSSYKENREFSINLVIPLYKGGYYTSLERASKLNIKSSQKDIEALLDDLKLQYKETRANINSAIRSISLYEKALEAAVLTKNIVNKEFSHGIKSILDLQEAEYKITQIKDKSIDNVTTLVDNYLTFLTLTNHFDALEVIDSIIKN